MKRFIIITFHALYLFFLSEAFLASHLQSRSVSQNLKRSYIKLYASADDKRKAEIAQKIKDLKEAGKITANSDGSTGGFQDIKSKQSVADQYGDKLANKLGRKARYMGVSTGKRKDKKDETTDEVDDDDDDDVDVDEPAEDDEEDEEEMLEMVAARMAEKREAKRAAERAVQDQKLKELKEKMAKEKEGNNAPRTSGVGGAFSGQNETAMEDTYKPAGGGSWGVFERPKDISKAYGGGRRIGLGYQQKQSAEEKAASEERSRQRIAEYNRKMGIDVPSEEEHADQISDAMKIARRAMDRGIYETAVSALEKVTPWCSSNSKVGAKVFLELGMAYEAIGRSDEATQLYTKLSTSRQDDVKNNAKRLLYNRESYDFMKDEVKASSFNRKQAVAEYIKATGWDTFGDNVESYSFSGAIDVDSYKLLTENVVRDVREARTIVLESVDSGIHERTKIVQALRSLSRGFDEAIQQEKDRREFEAQDVVMVDGEAIVRPMPDKMTETLEFKLASPEVMVENLSGEWRLQLIADETGNGVKFYNKTLSWLSLNTEEMQFQREGQVGFLPLSETGGLEFEDNTRILRTKDIEASGGGSVMTGIFGIQNGASCTKVAQEIMTVDSIVLITRCAEVLKWQDKEKEQFAVWRRVKPGTFSSTSS